MLILGLCLLKFVEGHVVPVIHLIHL